MTVTQHIALIPRDGFFCKDGRGWHTSTTGRGHGLDWPWPSTVLGALRTASGRDREADGRLDDAGWREHATGVKLTRLLALRRPLDASWDVKHRVWPVPQDAIWLESKIDSGGKPEPDIRRLKPRAATPDDPRTLGRQANGDEGLREDLWFPRNIDDDAKPLPRPRWWSEETFVAWLAGKAITDSIPKWGDPIRRVQTRVGIDPETLAAEDTVLFSHDVIETLDLFEDTDGVERPHEWAIGAEVQLASKIGQKTVRLGSDSRLAWIEEPGDALFKASDDLLKAFENGSPGLRLVVVTPAKFPSLNRHGPERMGGWLPSGFTARDDVFQGQLRGIDSSDVILRAALVPRPMHVSGWNMTGGGAKGGAANDTTRKNGGAPREAQRLVAPSAVYFFERADKTPFTRTDAEKLWLSAMGARTDEGFGLVVPGVWDPKETNSKEQKSC